MTDSTIIDRKFDEITCGWCGYTYSPRFIPKDGSPMTMGTPENQLTMSMKCSRCGNNEYTKTTYVTEDGKVPLTISN